VQVSSAGAVTWVNTELRLGLNVSEIYGICSNISNIANGCLALEHTLAVNNTRFIVVHAYPKATIKGRANNLLMGPPLNGDLDAAVLQRPAFLLDGCAPVFVYGHDCPLCELNALT
jgi:hypothetical protein